MKSIVLVFIIIIIINNINLLAQNASQMECIKINNGGDVTLNI